MSLSVLIHAASAADQEDAEHLAPLDPGVNKSGFPKDFIWQAEEMPLKVLISIPEMDGTRALRYEKILMASFSEWNKATGGAVAFVVVPDLVLTNCCVNFEERPADKKSHVSCAASRLYARDPDTVGARAWINADVTLGSGGTAVTDDQIRAVDLHEIGHALGLLHSSDRKDIMYAGAKPSAQHLSAGDIAQFERTYGSLPKHNAEETRHQLQEARNAIDKQLNDELRRSKEYLQSNPNDKDAHLQMARVYENMGKFGEAETEYRKAASLDLKASELQSELKWLPGKKQLYQITQLANISNQ